LLDLEEEAAEVLVSLDDLIEGLREGLQLLTLVVTRLLQTIRQLLLQKDSIRREITLVQLLRLVHRGVMVGAASLRGVRGSLIRNQGRLIVQIKRKVLLGLELSLTRSKGHSLKIWVLGLQLTISIRSIERVVKGEVEVGLDLLFLWQLSILTKRLLRHLPDLFKSALRGSCRLIFQDFLLISLLQFLLNISKTFICHAEKGLCRSDGLSRVEVYLLILFHGKRRFRKLRR
jgi:hypothetical protein